jgi:hypothetical protein
VGTGRSLCIAGALALSIVAAQSVTASTSTRRDNKDTRGPLDVVRVQHGHARGNDKVLTHAAWTTGRWNKKDLRNKNSYIAFWFSTDGDGYAEHRIFVASRDGRLVADFHDYEEGSDYAGVGPSTLIRWTRPNKRSIRVFLHRKHLGVDEYGWSVQSTYRSSSSRRCRAGHAPCYDKAPAGRGRGRVVHSLD